MNLIILYILTLLTYIHFYVTPCDTRLKIPKNKTQYVNGKSRYYLMTGGHRELRLEDLWSDVQDPDHDKGGFNNKYTLFTRKNAYGNAIVLGDKRSVENAYYNPSLPLNVIIHDWGLNPNDRTVTVIKDAFLRSADSNVLVVDWSAEAQHAYAYAAEYVVGVGKNVGQLLRWLIKLAGGSYDLLHIVGFGLGAHIAGNAGRTIGSQARRVTGLDPTGPLFYFSKSAMRHTDGRYVEVIHTDSRVNGLRMTRGHADFYPNGLYNLQPGCMDASCSHYKAPEMFAATIDYPNTLIGRKCIDSDIKTAITPENCQGESLKMGTDDLLKRGVGVYALRTANPNNAFNPSPNQYNPNSNSYIPNPNSYIPNPNSYNPNPNSYNPTRYPNYPTPNPYTTPSPYLTSTTIIIEPVDPDYNINQYTQSIPPYIYPTTNYIITPKINYSYPLPYPNKQPYPFKP